MNLLEFMSREFISIVESLEESEDIENNRVIIEKEHFRKMLEKYPYMKFRDKTRVYKDLGFIIHDKNNYTMPYKDKETKKTVRKVIINYKAYSTLKQLLNQEVK